MNSHQGQLGSGSPARSRCQRSRGFSLIELLIVVAVILVIAAIAIPNFLRSRMAANEAAAVASCRNITTALVVYSTTYGNSFASQLSYLGPPSGGGAVSPTGAELIDQLLANGEKSGYRFSYVPEDANGDGIFEAFVLYADPVSPGVTGNRHFFTDTSGVVRANPTGSASATDTPI